ncbi:hypothetical protein, partial [Sulfitobacter pontiacus]|uniref:hypothetical protein n=1 Tax=Sulfitobacter pontiacus TaxID=60137 RepID=UPI003299A9DE
RAAPGKITVDAISAVFKMPRRVMPCSKFTARPLVPFKMPYLFPHRAGNAQRASLNTGEGF